MIACNSLFDRDHLMFCKSGILIFIFAEKYYSIYAHTMFIKTPLLHQSFGPRVFLSFYFWLIPWSAEARWAHFLARASKPLSRRRAVPSPTPEGAWCLRAAARALRTGLCWLSARTRGYQPLFLSHFLIIDSGPPGSRPLKDQQETILGIYLRTCFCCNYFIIQRVL